MKYKVLEVAAVEFPPDSRIERSMLTLKERGYTVGLLCLKNPRNNITKWNGCRLYRLPFSESKLPTPINWIVDYTIFTLIGAAYVYYIAVKERYDIIHYNNPPDFMVPLLVPLKLLGKKIVYDAHEVTHLLLKSRISGTLGAVISKIMSFSQKIALMSSNIVITVSELAKQELLRLNKRSKVYVVENTVMDVPRIKKRRRDTTIIFSYVGSFLSDRDIDTIISAFSSLKNNDTLLWLIGGKLESQDKRVKSWGRLPHKKALELYAKSDVALITLADSPINRISNANRLYEAMALGKAIICADLPGPRSILKDAGVYYTPGSATSLKKAMYKFIKNPKLIQAYGKKAKKLFVEEYTWNKIGKKLIAAYKEVIGGYK